ncbi:MAG: endo-1,4-beta-xylanase [Saccharofermentans sp.]|nr:endo-1,4-beta-xylanase [Saccharofermentans sp.]
MADLDHRKTTKLIRFTDDEERPLAGRCLKIEQTSHKFLFGCGGFDFVDYFQAEDEEKKAFYKDRMDKWVKVFNYATLPFYLGTFEPEEGCPQTESRMQAAKYLTERGVTVKGHPLVWHTVCADWLMKYDNETILDKLTGRIGREVGGFKGIIDMWDVINEVVIMPVFDKYDNAVTRVCNEYGQVPLVKTVFDAARSANPEAELLLNDFNTSPKYEELIERCLDAGVPITAIGIQSHQHQGYWGKEKILDVLERFGRFGLPIHFTENTLTSGDYLVPAELDDLNDFVVTTDEWPSTPAGEKRQAEQMEEMYTLLFEDPNVQAITTWDFTDGAWLNAPSGFLRLDNSEKPSYHLLHDLIFNRWHTEAEVVTNEDGIAEITGFKGTYKVKTTDADTKIGAGMDEFEL